MGTIRAGSQKRRRAFGADLPTPTQRVARSADLRPTSVYAFPTELGWVAISWSGERLQGFTMGHPSGSAAEAALDAGGEPTSDPPPFVRSLADRIAAHVAGAPEDFRDVRLDLSHLTAFQRKVVEQCRQIRPGQTLTYGELAAKAGYPGAARAVGSTMARNRFPIVVPCHRVVGAAGSLGGFSAPSGVSLKRRLLEVESRGSKVPRTAMRPR